ncbi:hypothetical protein C0J52_16977 [Blattella germanica]|nr:hypothetical protein C0J52_16977 [Blattella germanica]
MKTTLKSKINPAAIKVGIKTFKGLTDGRVLIEVGTEEEIETLSTTINSNCGQTMEANISTLRNPNLIIYDVPAEITKDNIQELIISQNPDLGLQAGDIKEKN